MSHVSVRTLRTRWIAPSLLLACTVLAFPARAQSASLTGSWTVAWDSGIRSQGTQVLEVQRRSKGELRLRQEGDSVKGVWLNGMDGAGSASQGVAVSGTLTDGKLLLKTGESVDRGAATQVTFAAELKGARLVGVMFVQLGTRPAPARHWEGDRIATSK